MPSVEVQERVSCLTVTIVFAPARRGRSRARPKPLRHPRSHGARRRQAVVPRRTHRPSTAGWPRPDRRSAAVAGRRQLARRRSHRRRPVYLSAVAKTETYAGAYAESDATRRYPTLVSDGVRL